MASIHPQRRAVVQGDEDNTDIEDGDGGGSNPPTGCGDNGGCTV